MFTPDGGPALVLARGFAVAFLLSTSGALTFMTLVVPRVFGPVAPEDGVVVMRALRRWTWLSLVLGIAGLAVWLLAITANLAEPRTIDDWVEGSAAVLTATAFGRVVVAQTLLLAVAGVLLGRNPGPRRWRLGLLPGTAATVIQVGHGHAYAMAHGVSVLELSEALHLWAAGAWLGGIPPLLIVTWLAPPAVAAAAARWFSPLGKVCVVVAAVSAAVQGWVLVGSTNALLRTGYGWTALMKLGLFIVLLGFALLNRYRLAPDLRGLQPALARRRLIVSLAVQTGFGVLIVFVAALLGQLQPGMSMPGG